jgi:poly-gamma-glutamate synthesis protein (capsule biosynthesis protein)
MSKVKLIAVGDITLQTRNDSHPFEKVKKVFQDKDVLFGNLETVLSNRGKVAEKAVVLFTSPDKVVRLKDAGFDILNIANNHIMDLGVEGVNETLDVLNQNNLRFIGCSIRINGIDEENIIKEIRSLKPECDAIILSLHWGTENIFYPSPKQIALAHKLIDSGATIILGHHPHVIQGIERYKNGLIAYSLGNFQFNHSISYSPNNQSFIFTIELTKDGLEAYDVIPVKIDDDFVPYVPTEEEQEEIRGFITEISQHIINGTITWGWWFEQIAGEYLSGNMKSFVIRIKKYGVKHLLQCLLWLISPFCIKCYMGLIRKRINKHLKE